MRVGIKKISRKHWELRIDGNLAATAASLDEMEQQLRIMAMIHEMGEASIKGDL